MSFKYRRQRLQEERGVDDWLMTYADMITLLLCFFAVFLSVSVPKKEMFEIAKQRVLDKFSASDNILEGKFPVQPDQDKRLPYDSMPSIVGQNPDQHKADKTADPVKQGEVQKKQPEMPKGDRIIMIDVPSATLFASGSAQLSADGKAVLTDILEKNLKTRDAEGYQITVEGHTDDVPIKTLQFPSNWELSTARAAVVVRFFVEQGIPAQRLRVAGYGDALPKVPNRDASGTAIPANQAENRRVIIRLEKIEKAQ